LASLTRRALPACGGWGRCRGAELVPDVVEDLVRYAWNWRARLCTLLRFTGLRVDEQVMKLRWSDVDLERAELTIRGELGKSAAEREGRIVPISPHLVEILSGWGVREGYLVGTHKEDRVSDVTHQWRWGAGRRSPGDRVLGGAHAGGSEGA
jgi:integrase